MVRLDFVMTAAAPASCFMRGIVLSIIGLNTYTLGGGDAAGFGRGNDVL
jgi:hypothetical protein